MTTFDLNHYVTDMDLGEHSDSHFSTYNSGCDAEQCYIGLFEEVLKGSINQQCEQGETAPVGSGQGQRKHFACGPASF